jgi:hypothetical protein
MGTLLLRIGLDGYDWAALSSMQKRRRLKPGSNSGA